MKLKKLPRKLIVLITINIFILNKPSGKTHKNKRGTNSPSSIYIKSA